MRSLAVLVLAAQLLTAAHALWHHHDHDEGEHQDHPCAFCLALDQPVAPPPPPAASPIPARPHAPAPHAPPVLRPVSHHPTTSIRGPPRPDAGPPHAAPACAAALLQSL